MVNVCGKTTEEYIDVVERLGDQPVDMLEINISCPNVKEGGIAFGQDPKAVEAITREVKAHARQPIIMKLSPNVTDITVMARAAEAGGADAISLINTLTGMKIDIHKRAFALANRTGGLSGPAVKPVAVRMVYQAAPGSEGFPSSAWEESGMQMTPWSSYWQAPRLLPSARPISRTPMPRWRLWTESGHIWKRTVSEISGTL